MAAVHTLFFLRRFIFCVVTKKIDLIMTPIPMAVNIEHNVAKPSQVWPRQDHIVFNTVSAATPRCCHA